MDAFRVHRCFATSGARIGLFSTIDGQPMGSRIVSSAGATLRLELEVQGPETIEEIALIIDGDLYRCVPGGGEPTAQAAADYQVPPGPHWAYWKVKLPGDEPHLPGNISVTRGRYAWTSPHWITCEDAPV